MVKIQFIIVGWHFDKFPELIKDLIELNNQNSNIDIFWSCHKKPAEVVRNNFNYQVFPNLGLEDGAYQQALDYLNISDDTVLFLMHDDILVKDWSFINLCLEKLNNGFTFIGNGRNYPAQVDIDSEVKGKKLIEYVKPSARHLFTQNGVVLTIRESFICTVRKYLKSIYDFEVIWEEPQPDENGKYHIGGIGNLQQTLLGYKITSVFGPTKVYYLSNNYQDSKFLYEYARGVK